MTWCGAGSVQVAGASKAFLGKVGSKMIGAEERKMPGAKCQSRLVMRISPHSHEPGLLSASGGHVVQHPVDSGIYPGAKLEELSNRLPDVREVNDPKAKGAVLLAKHLLHYLSSLAKQHRFGVHSAVLMGSAPAG